MECGLKDNCAIFQKPQKSKSFNSFEIGLKSMIICGGIITEVEMCRNILVSNIEGVKKKEYFVKNEKVLKNAFLNTTTILHRSFLLSII